MINNDITSIKGYDYEELKLILLLCKQVIGCPLDKLFASQIDINYRVNQSDNYVNKTQGMMNLYSMNLPLEHILKSSKLFNDIKTVAKEWQERLDSLKAQPTETIAVEEDGEDINVPNITDKTDNRVVGANNDNNTSQE
jgi:hypothetical protein